MSAPMNAQRILNISLASEPDAVLVRQRARQVSKLLGYSQQDQVRIATAVSEVTRAACQLGFGGTAAFFVRDVFRRQQLEVVIAAGIGGHVSDEAVVTAHRLMDECRVEQGPGPTLATMPRLVSSSSRVSASKSSWRSRSSARVATSSWFCWCTSR